MSKVAQQIIKNTILSRNMIDPSETYLCAFLRKVTDYAGEKPKAVYEHLQPTIHLLGKAGDVVAISTAIRMGIPQAIGKASEYVAPANNAIYDRIGSSVQYASGGMLTGIGKLMTGESDVKTLLQDGFSAVKSDVYNKVSSLMGGAVVDTAKAAESSIASPGFYEQAYKSVVDNLDLVQRNASDLVKGAVELKDQASQTITGNLSLVQKNVTDLVQGAASVKDQASQTIADNLALVQKNVTDLVQGAAELKDQAYKGIVDAIPVIKESAGTLRDGAIAFAKENQTALTIVAGVAAVAAVGYVGYTMYNHSTAGPAEKVEVNPKEMAARLSEEFKQIKASRESAFNEERAKLESKFKEVKGYLKDSDNFSLKVLDSFCEEIVSQYNKDQTINPNDIKRVDKIVSDGLAGSRLSAENIKKIQKTSIELIASVMTCDELRQDISRSRVSPSFVEKEVAKKSGKSEGRSKTE